jgi:hypothetical protein
MAKQSVSIEIDGQRYGEMDQIPRKVPEGRVLAHNHARHTADMGCGWNGFRWWTWPKEQVPPNFAPCACGYAGLPHVAFKKHADSYKCETWEVIKALG